MTLETIGIFSLLILAIFYLIYNFRNQVKSHNCDKCGLMEMKKQSDLINRKD